MVEYCGNDHPTNKNLQIKCNTKQITCGILHRKRKFHIKIRVKLQRTLIVKAILSKTNNTRDLFQTQEIFTELQSFKKYAKKPDMYMNGTELKTQT